MMKALLPSPLKGLVTVLAGGVRVTVPNDEVLNGEDVAVLPTEGVIIFTRLNVHVCRCWSS